MTFDICNNCNNCCKSNKWNPNRVPIFKSDLNKNIRPIMIDNENTNDKFKYVCNHVINNECNDYNHRPLVCKWYPFYIYKLPDGLFTLGIAVRDDCDLGRYLVNHIKDESIIELSKSVFNEMISELTEDELNNWTNEYSYRYLLDSKLFNQFKKVGGNES